jgi:hypothetical protein
MNKINWKIVGATLTSALAALSALPYTLGDLATVIPPAYKAKVFTASLIATAILRLWNTQMVTPQPPSQQPPQK